MNFEDAERRILRHGWLADQSPELKTAVMRQARLISVSARDSLFHSGDEPGGIYGIVSGGVGMWIAGRSAESRLVHIGRCGTWFGYGPLVLGGPRSLLVSFNILEPGWIFGVSLSCLQQIAKMSPEHQRALLSISEYGLKVALHTIETLMIPNTERRIAATLLRIAPNAEDVPKGAPDEILLTQAQLGEMANAERKVVNRALSRMEREGWLVVSYGRIRLVDRDALDAFWKEE